MHRYAFIVAALFSMAPLGATAADLVVWWEQGYHARGGRGGPGDRRHLRAGHRQAVELVRRRTMTLWPKSLAAVQAGQPPIFCSV